MREIKEHIHNQQCRNLPPHLAKHILQMNDDDGNGVMDFDEFYRMSIRQEWLFHRLVKQYCRILVPPPRRTDADETGNFSYLSKNRIRELIFMLLFVFFGSYEIIVANQLNHLLFFFFFSNLITNIFFCFLDETCAIRWRSAYIL